MDMGPWAHERKQLLFAGVAVRRSRCSPESLFAGDAVRRRRCPRAWEDRLVLGTTLADVLTLAAGLHMPGNTGWC